MALSALIVDDEPLARAGLRLLLAEDPEFASVSEAADGRQALALIRALGPSLVFLDVQMPEIDGFAVVRELSASEMPAIVFVTAHDQYAVRAFEVHALDYLLKPVTRERFMRTLARAKSHVGVAAADAGQQMRAMLDAIAAPGRYASRLAVRSTGRVTFVDVGEIDWIQAAENYVELHCGSTCHLLHATMTTIEASLDPGVFVRVHRSAIVNITQVAAMAPVAHGEYRLTLRSGAQVKSGRTYASRVRALTVNPF